jgi:very-short-patch-repair endonuclease
MFDVSPETCTAPIPRLALHDDATVRVDRRELIGRALRSRRVRDEVRPSPLLMAWARARLERGDDVDTVLGDCLVDGRLCAMEFAPAYRVGSVVATWAALQERVAVVVYATLTVALRSRAAARLAEAGWTVVAVGADEMAAHPHRVLRRIAEAVAAAR